MTVNTEWKKTGIYVEHDMGNGKTRRRNFNGVSEKADSEKIAQFADIIGKLTGEEVLGIQVTRTEEVVQSPAVSE